MANDEVSARPQYVKALCIQTRGSIRSKVDINTAVFDYRAGGCIAVDIRNWIHVGVLEKQLVAQDFPRALFHTDDVHLAPVRSCSGHPNLVAPDYRRGPASAVDLGFPLYVLGL